MKKRGTIAELGINFSISITKLIKPSQKRSAILLFATKIKIGPKINSQEMILSLLLYSAIFSPYSFTNALLKNEIAYIMSTTCIGFKKHNQ